MLPSPFDEFTPDDWRHLREEAERMREPDEEMVETEETGESPMEQVMTSYGYVDLWSGFEEGEAEVMCDGVSLKEDEWPEPEEDDEEAE